MVSCVWKILTVQQVKSTVVFPALCLLSLQSRWIQSYSVTLNINGQQQLPKKTAQNFTINKDGLLGKVLVGNATQPICVPGNSALTIPADWVRTPRYPVAHLAL